MLSLPPLEDRELSLINRYTLEEEEEMVEAVVNASLAAGVDVQDRPNLIGDWVVPAVLENRTWSENPPLAVWTEIWDHTVLLTPDEVHVYRDSGGSAEANQLQPCLPPNKMAGCSHCNWRGSVEEIRKVDHEGAFVHNCPACGVTLGVSEET